MKKPEAFTDEQWERYQRLYGPTGDALQQLESSRFPWALVGLAAVAVVWKVRGR